MSSPHQTDYTGVKIHIAARDAVRGDLARHLNNRFPGAVVTFEMPVPSIPETVQLISVKVQENHPVARMASSEFAPTGQPEGKALPDGASIILEEVEKFLGLLRAQI